MIRTQSFFLLAVLLLAVLVSTGCGNRAQSDRLDYRNAQEVFDRAQKARMAGNTEETRRLLEGLVAQEPANALARLELGTFLQDSAKEPYEALAEYKAYLRLAPGSDKASIVSNRIVSAKSEIAGRLGRQLESGASDDDWKKLDALQIKAGEQEKSLAEKTHEIEKLSAELQSTKDELEKALRRNRAPYVPWNGGDAPNYDLWNAVVNPADDFRPIKMTYRVKRGDTLQSIARMCYGDPVQKIVDANPDKFHNGRTVVVGTLLDIP